jgi:hypothetical protein
VIKLQHE